MRIRTRDAFFHVFYPWVYTVSIPDISCGKYKITDTVTHPFKLCKRSQYANIPKQFKLPTRLFSCHNMKSDSKWKFFDIYHPLTTVRLMVLQDLHDVLGRQWLEVQSDPRRPVLGHRIWTQGERHIIFPLHSLVQGPYVQPSYATTDRGRIRGHKFDRHLLEVARGRRPIVMFSPISERVLLEVAGSIGFHTLRLAKKRPLLEVARGRFENS